MKVSIPKNYRGGAMLYTVTLFLCLLIAYTTQAYAGTDACPFEGCSSQEIVFTPGERHYITPDAQVTMDAAPFVESGRVYVPVRYLANSIGVADEDIDCTDGIVRLTPPGLAVQLQIGAPTIEVNGDVRQMDVPLVMRSGRTYLPARYVAEAFGYEVTWDGKMRITLPEPKEFTGGMIEPDPIAIQGSDKYYSITDILVAVGVPEGDFQFDTDNVLSFCGGYEVTSLVLFEDSENIYMVDNLGELHGYALDGKLERRGETWVVKNKSDLIKVGMLGTILQAGDM